MEIFDFVRFRANGGASRLADALTPTWAFERSVGTSKWLLSSFTFEIYLALMTYELAVASHFIHSTEFGASGKTQEMLFVTPPHSVAASDFLTERMLTIYSVSSVITLDELLHLLETNRFISVHYITIHRELERAGVSPKKLKCIALRERRGETSNFCRKDCSV
jgi:hypothetical protein